MRLMSRKKYLTFLVKMYDIHRKKTQNILYKLQTLHMLESYEEYQDWF